MDKSGLRYSMFLNVAGSQKTGKKFSSKEGGGGGYNLNIKKERTPPLMIPHCQGLGKNKPMVNQQLFQHSIQNGGTKRPEVV